MRRVLAGLLLVATAGCADSMEPPAPAPQAEQPEQLQYAALGDSYTAAPYVVSTDVANGCLRSEHNYPSLVADRLGAELTDVSCGSADTADVNGSQRTLGSGVQPPQIEAVTAGTDLVTVGLGGNDGKLFGRLVSQCPITGPRGETYGRSGRCGYMPEAVTDKLLQGTQRDLTRVLREVKRRAPEALVVLVGYPRLLGAAPCKELPIAAADLQGAAQVAVRLRDAQLGAARAAGVEFVDMHRLSRTHDACSEEPWVRGVDSDQHDGAAMHPTTAGQKAMAAAVSDRLTKAGL